MLYCNPGGNRASVPYMACGLKALSSISGGNGKHFVHLNFLVFGLSGSAFHFVLQNPFAQFALLLK